MSETNKQFDLTRGPILNRLLLVALPIMGIQLMQMAYNLTDMFWLGRLGSDAVAASGSAGMYTWLGMGLMLIGRMGAEIGVSQSVGRGDESAAKAYAANSLFWGTLLGILYGLIMIVFARPLIGFFAIPQAHVAADAAGYLAIVGVGVPMTYVSGAITGIFNGSGNSRTPFYINGIGLIVNMILDPVLILTLDMGIAGAAIATVAAQILVCLLSLWALHRSKGRPFAIFGFTTKPDLAMAKQIVRWTLPIALESMLFSILSMVISRFVAAFGADAIAVQRVGSQIESLTWLIGGGFGTALTAYVGQNYGAGQWTRIHRGFRLSFAAMSVWGVLVTLVLFFGGSALYRVFLREPEIVQAGVVYLRILATCQLVACWEAVAAGAFRGVGNTIPPSAVSVGANFIRIFISYGLSQTALGINGIWWGVTIGSILRGGVILLWYLLAARRMPTEDRPLPSQDSSLPPQPGEA